jgi:cyclic pyranopterin phosphate synthase
VSATRDGGRLVDACGRRITDLRISVTDRCNLRCNYCVPSKRFCFVPHERVLSFEEIARVATVAASLGVRKLRLTGGEPLVRRNLPELVAMLSAIDGVGDVPITTNGVLLAAKAEALYGAGVRRINISLDTLDRERFYQIARRDHLDRVLEGVAAAQTTGFPTIKINMIPIRGVNDDEVVAMARWAIGQGLNLRFIEYMPFGTNGWSWPRVVPASELRARLAAEFPLGEPRRASPSAPAVDYPVQGTKTCLSVIPCVTEPFCAHCTRMRLTAEGRLRPCLHDEMEVDLVRALRSGASDEMLRQVFQQAAAAKPAGRHGFGPTYRPADATRPMMGIGG